MTEKYILLVIIFISIFVFYVILENNVLFLTRHEGLGGKIRIFHISDNHKKNNEWYNKRILKAAVREKPDLIFITGDIVSRSETDFSATEKLLNRLCMIAPVYMCMGNHEQSMPDDKLAEFLSMIARTNAKMLINERCTTEINGRTFYICGVMQNYSTYKKEDSYNDLDTFDLGEMERIMPKLNRNECDVLLLAHNPLFAEVYAEWGADHTFSGHIHGGVVRIFGKGLLSPERRFFPKYSKGMYNVGRMKLHVSAGIGKLRLFDPPEVVVYNI